MLLSLFFASLLLRVFALSFVFALAAAASSVPAAHGDFRAAAASSRILAAFSSIRRRFSCFPPSNAPQNSPFGGASRVCRRSLRQQFAKFAPQIAVDNYQLCTCWLLKSSGSKTVASM
jgi:hypothetical protein